MSDLKITNLHKHYGAFHAVKGIDLEVPSGEFTVLVGPSGCGKSTLLRTIAGLEEASSGKIEIGGQDVTWARPRDRNIAMVFQNYALYPYLTVKDNVAFGLRSRKVPEAEVEKRVSRAAEMLGIGHLLARFPRELSGGQRQRVAIGRAIVRDAILYLFDEPLSNLDAQLRDDMRVEIKRLHQELGRTMVYVTHDQIEAMTLADRIVLLRDGEIEQQGTPLDLFERPKTRFVAGFLGSPKMNFIPATTHRDRRGAERRHPARHCRAAAASSRARPWCWACARNISRWRGSRWRRAMPACRSPSSSCSPRARACRPPCRWAAPRSSPNWPRMTFPAPASGRRLTST